MKWQQIIVVMYICSSNNHNATYENIGWNSASDRCYKMFRINTDSWKLQVLIKRMDSESSLSVSVQDLSSIYTRVNDSTIHFTLLWIINYQFSVKMKQVTNFCTHSSRITCARRGGVEVHVAGLTVSVSGDQDSIPGLPSPLVGYLMVRRLNTSSNNPVSVFGWLDTLKTPSCPWRWVPGSRS